MTTITSTNPRQSTRMRVVRKTYVLNPKLREEHDDKAFKITRVCELCRKPSRLVDYPKVFGAKLHEMVENKYGKVCKKCLSKETMKNIVFEAINKSNRSDEDKLLMKSKAMECIYVKGLDILKTKAELGLKPVAGGLDGKVKVIIGEPANKNVTIKNG